MTPHEIRALADQFICHPASRDVSEIELAGEVLRACAQLVKACDEHEGTMVEAECPICCAMAALAAVGCSPLPTPEGTKA